MGFQFHDEREPLLRSLTPTDFVAWGQQLSQPGVVDAVFSVMTSKEPSSTVPRADGRSI